MMMGFLVIGLGKTIKKCENSENSSGYRVAPLSSVFFGGVSTPFLPDLQNQEKMYQ